MAGQSRDRNIANSPPNGAFENTKLDLQRLLRKKALSLSGFDRKDRFVSFVLIFFLWFSEGDFFFFFRLTNILGEGFNFRIDVSYLFSILYTCEFVVVSCN